MYNFPYFFSQKDSALTKDSPHTFLLITPPPIHFPALSTCAWRALYRRRHGYCSMNTSHTRQHTDFYEALCHQH